jgi:membrane fusion protein, multidrug efflux system
MNAKFTMSALAAGALIFSGCSSRKKPSAEAVPVTVGTVMRKSMPVELAAIGNVQPYSTVAVKALINGELTEVHFREGQDVRKGDLLFTIDPRPYQAALAQAEAALARDRAQAKNAEADARRYAELVEKDYVTQEQFDQTQAASAAAQATVQADEAAVEAARVNLGYCTIRSPIDGRTGNLMVHAGNVIKANDVPLVTINQITPVYVAFSVPEQQLSEIKKRAAAGKLDVLALLAASGAEPNHGQLSFIDNAVDPSTGTIQLKATFPNRSRSLWPGEFVNVRLVLSQESNAVVAPARAVQTGQEGEFVFVVKSDDTVESRPVTVARTVDQDAIIEKGLDPGERVVTDGQLRLVPGARVEIKSDLSGGGAETRS